MGSAIFKLRRVSASKPPVSLFCCCLYAFWNGFNCGILYSNNSQCLWASGGRTTESSNTSQFRMNCVAQLIGKIHASIIKKKTRIRPAINWEMGTIVSFMCGVQWPKHWLAANCLSLKWHAHRVQCFDQNNVSLTYIYFFFFAAEFWLLLDRTQCTCIPESRSMRLASLCAGEWETISAICRFDEHRTCDWFEAMNGTECGLGSHYYN